MNSTKQQELIETLESAQAELEALLTEAGEARLTTPGVTGPWSIKDLLAHTTAWESRVVAWAEGIRQGTHPAPTPWPKGLDDDQVNAIIFDRNRDRSLPEVLESWRQTHRQVMEAVQAMNDDQLFDQKIQWLGDIPFADAIAGNSYEHQQEHAEQIRLWLDAG